MAISKKTSIILAAVASVVLLTAGAIVGMKILGDQAAQTEYDSAESELQLAANSLESAESDLEATTASAMQWHERGAALLAVTDETMLSDASRKAALSAALNRVAELASSQNESAAGGNESEDEGSADKTGGSDSSPTQSNGAAPESASAPASESAPESTSTSASDSASGDTATTSRPESNAELHAAASDMLGQAVPLRAKALIVAGHTDDLSKAVETVQSRALEALSSAGEKAQHTEIPEHASEESRGAFAAAVAGLNSVGDESDYAALMKSYLDSWQAVILSHQQALANQDPASIEPTYIRGILVVNKTYALPSWYGGGLTAETVSAFNSMQAEAASQGLDIYISSGFRSYASQESIYNRYVAADGRAEADRYSARPGHSEHQSGLTFDLNTIDEAFAYTPEGAWVRDNAHRFGFVIRYPQGKEHITGYIWEPWHLRYLGEAVATEVYNSGLSLEEYLGITSQYAD